MREDRNYLDSFHHLAESETRAIVGRVLLRNIYLAMGREESLGEFALLHTLRLILDFCAGPEKIDTEIHWETDFYEEVWSLSISSNAVVLIADLYEDHQYNELEWDLHNGPEIVQNHSPLSGKFFSDSGGDSEQEIDAGNLKKDIKQFLSSRNIPDLHSTPLWRRKVPSHILEACGQLYNFFGEDRKTWAFWSAWYQGFLDGKPLDWELQRRVALIPDEDWEKGPKHIAKLIEEIRARFELEKRIEALEAEKLVWEERARLGVGGNNPPEPLEDDRIVQEIIWAPIEYLKAETQSEVPDKSSIQAAISKLGAALIAIGKWPFGKLDKAADEFAKSLGKWGGGACAGWLALNSDKIAEVIKAAQAWLIAMF